MEIQKNQKVISQKMMKYNQENVPTIITTATVKRKHSIKVHQTTQTI